MWGVQIFGVQRYTKFWPRLDFQMSTPNLIPWKFVYWSCGRNCNWLQTLLKAHWKCPFYQQKYCQKHGNHNRKASMRKNLLSLHLLFEMPQILRKFWYAMLTVGWSTSLAWQTWKMVVVDQTHHSVVALLPITIAGHDNRKSYSRHSITDNGKP